MYQLESRGRHFGDRRVGPHRRWRRVVRRATREDARNQPTVGGFEGNFRSADRMIEAGNWLLGFGVATTIIVGWAAGLSAARANLSHFCWEPAPIPKRIGYMRAEFQVRF